MKSCDHNPIEASNGFEAQVSPHLQSLSTLAWRYTHNTAMAQDLLQDTLLKAYRFFYRYEDGTNLWAWLLTIMRNLYFSKVRKLAREETLVDVDRIPLGSAHATVNLQDFPQPANLQAALPFLVTDEVLTALEDLPEEFRMAVLLADMLDYSYKDIATLVDCPLGTVMSRLYRGRQMLQKRLQSYATDQGYIHR